MTTLPQTAALRLPRPGFSSLPVTASIPASGALGHAQASFTMSGADVWRVIRSNLWLIVLLLVVSAGAGYGINYWLNKYHPRYTAEGKVVIPGMFETNVEGMLQQSSDFNVSSLPMQLRLHTTMMNDPALITKVLQNPNDEIRTTQWFKRYATIQEAKADLAEGELQVTSAPDSPLIVVSMTDSDPKSCQVVVQSFVDQYIKDQQEKSRDRQYTFNQDLAQQRITAEGQVKLDDGDISDLLVELSSDGVSGTVTKISEKDMMLQTLLQNRQVAILEEQTAKEKYAELERQIQTDPTNVPQVEAEVDKDPEIMNLRQMQTTFDMELGGALGGNMGPDSPMLHNIQQKKQMIDRREKTEEEKTRVRFRGQIEQDLLQKVQDAQTRAAMMDSNIQTIKGQMTQLTEKMQQLIQKQAERTVDEEKLKGIETRLEQITNYNARHEIGGVEWEAQPELPEIPSFPKLGATMTVSIALGLLLALGIAFLRELLDTTIRSPRDISRVGSLNLLGMVPHEDDDPQSAGARLPVVIFEAPHSMMAEQLRQVRTRLQHSSSLDTTRSILITSPSPGDGKSTIACNLAAGLALNGRRILLVDANFRRPDLHRVFNLANEQGFSDVLNSLDLFEHAVQETQVPNLFVLPSGHKPTNATELVESQLLVDFIERALEEFDHVIFDSGPLLFVSETVALAPRVDGVVSVVRARTNTRGVLSRMRDTLRQVKAEHLGVVLNAVRAQGGGYYGRNIRTYYEYQDNGGQAA
ncbi:MAG: polysaccharide biosynthesis tyrosine autokinase [Tepidisphaeraceae bacterium]|jgi:capsular exopolysaccharide synthesis family protein